MVFGSIVGSDYYAYGPPVMVVLLRALTSRLIRRLDRIWHVWVVYIICFFQPRALTSIGPLTPAPKLALM